MKGMNKANNNNNNNNNNLIKKSLSNEVKKTPGTAYLSMESDKKTFGSIKSLKTAKTAKDAEEMMKTIKKQIEGNESLKKAYIEKGIVKDIILLISDYEGAESIEYFAICLLNELIYNATIKSRIMEEGGIQKVMKIMRRCKGNQHIIYEGCKFCKKMMIQTNYSKIFVDEKIVNLIEDVLNEHQSKDKIVIEGCKCLKLIMGDNKVDCDNIGKMRIHVMMQCMKRNKMEREIQIELINEITSSLVYFKDLKYMHECGLLSLIFQLIKTSRWEEVTKSCLDMIESGFNGIEKKSFDERLVIGMEIMKSIDDNRRSIPYHLICLKTLKTIMINDEEIKEKLLLNGIDRLIYSVMSNRYPLVIENKDAKIFNFSDEFLNEDIRVIDICVDIIKLFFNNENMMKTLTDNGCQREILGSFEYSLTLRAPREGFSYNQLHQLQTRMLSLLLDLVVLMKRNGRLDSVDEIWAVLNGMNGNEILSNDLFEVRTAIMLEINDNIIGRIEICVNYFHYYEIQPFGDDLPGSIDNIARLSDRIECRREMMNRDIPRRVMMLINRETSDDRDVSLAMYIMYLFMQDEENIERLQGYGMIRFMQIGLRQCCEYQPDFFHVQHQTKYYCEEVLRICGVHILGNVDGNNNYNDNAHEGVSASTSNVKSATMMKRSM